MKISIKYFLFFLLMIASIVMISGAVILFNSLEDALLRTEINRIEHDLLEEKSRTIDNLLPSVILEEQKESLSLILKKLEVRHTITAEVIKSKNLCSGRNYCLIHQTNKIISYFKIIDFEKNTYFLKRTHKILTLAPLQSFHDNLMLYIASIPIVIFLLFLFLISLIRKYIEIPILEINKGNLNTKGKLQFSEILKLKYFVSDLIEKSIVSEVEKKKHETYRQVAHDIRSPLAALKMIANEIDSLPEVTRIMLRSSVNRIQDIANNLLLQKNNGSAENVNNLFSTYLILPIIEDVISEKRTALRINPNISIDTKTDNSFGVFLKIDQSHMKRIISNLINNSVDSFENKKGEINITYKKYQDKINIILSDNGKGIPKHIISMLGHQGASFGKENNNESGSGLGLFHAKQYLEKWGGSLKIESEEGKGTDLILTLPLQKDPSWFVSSLNLKSDQNIVIIDDDSSIHQIWDQRLKDIAKEYNIQVTHFTDPYDLKNWIKRRPNSFTTFLCDYEFIGHQVNGLDLIEELKIIENSILITSRYEEEEVRTRCEKLGVKLIPKMMAEMVPIKASKNIETMADLVHLDDDELIRMSWKFGAKKEGKKMLSFSHPKELMKNLNHIPKSTPFYIDSSLGAGVIKGQDLAKKLFELGFEELYLSTGFEKENFKEMPWIKGVLGKEAPWVDTNSKRS